MAQLQGIAEGGSGEVVEELVVQGEGGGAAVGQGALDPVVPALRVVARVGVVGELLGVGTVEGLEVALGLVLRGSFTFALLPVARRRRGESGAQVALVHPVQPTADLRGDHTSSGRELTSRASNILDEPLPVLSGRMGTPQRLHKEESSAGERAGKTLTSGLSDMRSAVTRSSSSTPNTHTPGVPPSSVGQVAMTGMFFIKDV